MNSMKSKMTPWQNKKQKMMHDAVRKSLEAQSNAYRTMPSFACAIVIATLKAQLESTLSAISAQSQFYDAAAKTKAVSASEITQEEVVSKIKQAIDDENNGYIAMLEV